MTVIAVGTRGNGPFVAQVKLLADKSILYKEILNFIVSIGENLDKTGIFLSCKEMQNTAEKVWENLWITCC